MKKLLAVLIIIPILTVTGFSQADSAGLYGKVLNPGGSAAAGVTVTLTGDKIGELSKSTASEGNFRFLKLPPGTYQLRLEKAGFKTLVYKGISMFVGQNKNLVVRLETGATEEELVVTGKSGALDVRSPVKAFNITKKMLQALPTARNPWTIINLVPGMLLDREDVGGSESGQQSKFYGMGTSRDETTWHIDGLNISNPASIGDAPAYLDTNVYEEIQVTLAANDITAQTGGTQLNFVTGRGGNRSGGSFFLYVEDDACEMKQTLPESITENNWGSPGIIRLYQYGANFGGPLIKDKLWFYGSYAVQDIHARTITRAEDATWIGGGYGKIDFRFDRTSGFLKFSNDNKKKFDRYWIGQKNQAPETAWNQSGPHSIFQANLQQEVGGLFLNAKAAYMSSGFTLDPAANRANNNYIPNHEPGPDWYDYYTPSRYWAGSCQYFTTSTKSWHLSLDGSYFFDRISGSDHEIRFGVDYTTADTTSQTLMPNQRRLWIYDRGNTAGYKELWWICDSIVDTGFKRISFYFADTMTIGRFTANIGLRYDKETGYHNEASSPALTFNGTPIFAGYLGEVSSIPGKVDAAFAVFSPRVSLTYDIGGNGRNVLKASYGRYGSQSGNSLASLQWDLGINREIDVYWDDKNGNLQPDLGEWSEDRADWLWWNIDPNDPYCLNPPNKFDPNYNSPILDEFTLGCEKALGEDFMIALTGCYKKKSNLTWDRGMFSTDQMKPGVPVTYRAGDLETADNWYKVGDFYCIDGTLKPIYYRYFVPDLVYRTNYGSGTYQTYKALQLVLSKKLSHGWMLDASFTLSDWKSYYDPGEYFDKLNYDFLNGGKTAEESGGSGLSEVFVNSRWQVKIAGLYQLPFGINLTGVFRAREGYIMPYYHHPYRGWNIRPPLYEVDKKLGDDRLPAFWILNLGLEKTFQISADKTFTLFINGYNVTNNSTTLKVNPVINNMTGASGDILRILNPGIFQFGARISF